MTRRRYVGELEELLRPEDYDRDGSGRRVRIRIRRRADGRMELLADCTDPEVLDRIVEQLARELGVEEIEATLCG